MTRIIFAGHLQDMSNESKFHNKQNHLIEAERWTDIARNHQMKYDFVEM